VTGRRKREREKIGSVSTLAIGSYPCSYEKGAGGKVLIPGRENFFSLRRRFKIKGGGQMM
jgi:hypothetical protein